MAEGGQSRSWWYTLPGVLTGIAAVATAVTALIATLQGIGLFGGEEPEPPPPVACKKLVPTVGGKGPLHTLVPNNEYTQAAWALTGTHVNFGLEACEGTTCEVHVTHPLAGTNAFTLAAGKTQEASWFYGAGNITVSFSCNESDSRLRVKIW